MPGHHREYQPAVVTDAVTGIEMVDQMRHHGFILQFFNWHTSHCLQIAYQFSPFFRQQVRGSQSIIRRLPQAIRVQSATLQWPPQVRKQINNTTDPEMQCEGHVRTTRMDFLWADRRHRCEAPDARKGSGWVRRDGADRHCWSPVWWLPGEIDRPLP